LEVAPYYAWGNLNMQARKQMVRYKNLGGTSGIVAYETGETFIRIQFFDESVYNYTYASAGFYNIEYMKQLAYQGRGLNSFINKVVRKLYCRKEQ